MPQWKSIEIHMKSMEIQKSAFLSKNEVSDQKGSVLGGPNAGFWPVFGGPEDGFWGPNAGFRPK